MKPILKNHAIAIGPEAGKVKPERLVQRRRTESCTADCVIYVSVIDSFVYNVVEISM